MNKKILVPIIAFFALIPSAFALFPQAVNDIFQSIFGGFPSEVSSRGLFALIMFCIYFLVLGLLFKEKKQKNIRVVLALVLAIISGIGIPYGLLDNMYSAYGCIGGIVVVGFPIFGFIFLAWLIKPKGDNVKFAYGIRAIVFLLGATFLGAVVHTVGYECGGWGFTLREAADIIAFFLIIFAIINLVKLFGGEGGIEVGKGGLGLGPSKKPEEKKPEKKPKEPEKPGETKEPEEPEKPEEEGGDEGEDEEKDPLIINIIRILRGMLRQLAALTRYFNESLGTLAVMIVKEPKLLKLEQITKYYNSMARGMNTLKQYADTGAIDKSDYNDLLRCFEKAHKSYGYIYSQGRGKEYQGKLRDLIIQLSTKLYIPFKDDAPDPNKLTRILDEKNERIKNIRSRVYKEIEEGKLPELKKLQENKDKMFGSEFMKVVEERAKNPDKWARELRAGLIFFVRQHVLFFRAMRDYQVVLNRIRKKRQEKLGR